jgi:hypothetical protein
LLRNPKRRWRDVRDGEGTPALLTEPDQQFGERHLKTGIRRIVLSRGPIHKTWRLCGLAALP